ncbi:MAG TPA: undecaprenyl-diphosphatase UppP [Kofleriaceae bacterium]|jgi:undecaprenyl-diphosphatase
MSLWLAALLGLVQGLTEFIPVSSSAHLRIVPALLHKPDAGAAFTAIVQLGSLVAVVVYFWNDLVDVTVALFRAPGTPAGRLPWLLVVGTIPIGVVGLLLKRHVEGDLRSLYITASMFIIFGIVIWVIDHWSAGRPSFRPLDGLTMRDAVLIGIAQSLALVPGVSRSGGTICMALLLGFTRVDSARFSFLLSIPAIAASGGYECFEVLKVQGPGAIGPLAVGTGVAAVSSYAAIAWLLRFLTTHHFTGFAIYRIVCGAALLAALTAGWLQAL